MEDAQEQVGRRRKRVSRACDRCRSKKDRCDGIRPTCLACQNSGSICSYDPSAKKRGLPEGYVRGLEKLWALSISNIEGLEESVLSLLGANDEPGSTRRRKLISLWPNESISDKLHDSWKSTALFRELEKLLSAGDAESAPSTRGTSEHRDHSPERTESGACSSDLFEYRIAQDHTRSKSNSLEPDSSDERRSKKIKLSHVPSANTNSTSQLQLPEYTPKLLDLYFSHTQSWFPIIAKHSVLRTYYSYSTGALALNRKFSGSGNHAVLWAILSYATAQSKPLTDASQLVLPDPIATAKEFYSIARSLIPTEKENFEVGHVQALLLLTLVNIGLEDWTAAWLLSNQATSLVLHLGIGHQNAVGQQNQDNSLNKAIFLGCFVVDTILAIRLGRCSTMRPEDLTAVGFLEEDGLEEWNPWMLVFYPDGQPQDRALPPRGPVLSRSCFNRLVQLASFLNRISRQEPSSLDAPWFCQNFMKDMQTWEGKLPATCRLAALCNTAASGNRILLLPHQIYICLMHISTLSFFYMRFSSHVQVQGLFNPIRRLLQLAPALLAAHGEGFGQFIMPPIFEYPLRAITDCIRQARVSSEQDEFQRSSWLKYTSKETSAVGGIWPVLMSFAEEISFDGNKQAQHHSTNEQFQQPGSAASIVDMSRFPNSYHNPVIDGLENLSRSISIPQIHPPTALSRSAVSALNVGSSLKRATDVEADLIPALSPQNSASGRLDVQSNVAIHADLLEKNFMASYDSQASGSDSEFADFSTVSDQFSAHLQPSTPASTPPYAAPVAQISNCNAPSQSKPSLPVNDLDSIFDDFAHLDTNEWTINRDQSPRDFSFADEITFQAFCRDPERVTGTNALLRPASIADIWPPPGFFPDTFREDNEIETVAKEPKELKVA